MRTQIIKISTAAFHKLQECDHEYVSWSEEKRGPTQKILVTEEVYIELIDLAIAKRKTLDAIILEVCIGNSQGQDVPSTASTVSKPNR